MPEVDQELEQEIQNNPQFIEMLQKQLQNNPEMLEQLQQNPEMLRQFYQDYMGQEGIANEQLAQADALRNTQTGQGMQAGGQFVAGSPLSGLANVGNKLTAANQQRTAMDAKDQLSKDRTAGVTGMVKSINPLSAILRNPRLDINSLVDDASMVGGQGQYS